MATWIRSLLALASVALLTSSSAAAVGNVVMQTPVPYEEDAAVSGNVKAECTALGKKISDFTKIYAQKKGVTVDLQSDVDFAAAPTALRVEIVSAISSGNAFIGHNKGMTVRVELLERGSVKAKETFSRNSMGGFGGGFKSSCSVLGRVTKVLGKDIAEWLAKQ